MCFTSATSKQLVFAALIVCASLATAGAQSYTGLGYVPGGFRRMAAQQASYDCPCETPGPAPAPLGDAAPRRDEGTADEIPDPSSPNENLPEVADLSSDASYASASQSAAPNMIGDTIGYGGTGYINIGVSVVPYAPGGGRKFKASTNQSPVPQQRFFYNFHLFDDALATEGPPPLGGGAAPVDNIDVVRNEFGWEWLLCGGMASAQIQLPFSRSINSTLTQFDVDGTTLFEAPDDTDMELGNIALALKCLCWQSECDALSIGLAVDLPTASDVVIADVDGSLGTLSIENEALTLSPFVGYVYQSPCRWFAQGFAQLALPLNENDFRTTSGASEAGDLEETPVFYADIGVGFWFYSSDYDGVGCGGCKGSCDSYGVAGVVELHYSQSLDDEGVVVLNAGEGTTFTYSDVNWLNLTLGLSAYHNCWSLTPAVVLPVQDSPDRQFDVEWTVQINKQY